MHKILIIEDNADVRENTAEILELAGYEVFTAENGKEGVKCAQTSLPDLIICDIMMPVLDGYGVYHILSTDPVTSRLPFIFLSAKADPMDVRRGMSMGADDYITKPFEESELLKTIEIRLRKNEAIKNAFQSNSTNLGNVLSNESLADEIPLADLNVVTKQYSAKQHIYSQDDPTFFVYHVIKGQVKTYRSTSEAKDLITRICGPGDYLGYSDVLQSQSYSETAEAMEDCELQRIDKKDFLELVSKNRIVAASFIKLLAGDKLEQEKRLLDMAYHSVRIRLRNTLLSLEEKAEKKKDGFIIHMSREELASILGTSTETVIRTLSEFKKEGLLKLDKHEVSVESKKKLEEMRF